jgi:5-methylthioadenosine/S-adenosylhomocysteine deaminase
MATSDNLALIKGGRLLSPGAGVPDFADILVKNGVIAEISSFGTLSVAAGITVDAREMLVLPGLVNAHSHGQLNLSKGCNDRWSLELLLNRLPSVTAGRSAEYHYLSAQIGAAEMLSKGCTTVYDLFSEFPAPTPEGVDAVARAYSDIGMRAVVAPMMADRSFYQAIPGLLEAFPDELRADVERIRFAPYQESIERCRRIVKEWRHDRDLVRPALAPTIPHHCTDDFLVACRNLAGEFDVGIQMHVAESRVQAVVAPMVHGRTAVSHLAELGLLSPRFTAAHSVWLDDDDMARLADRGASVAHNPGSNLRLGSGLARVRRLLDAGVNVAIGTDGAITSDSLNMFEAIRLAALVSRVQDVSSERWISAAEAFLAGTIAGAKALGFGDRIGRIGVGCRADLVLLDLARPSFVPLGDPLNQAVYAEDGTSVASVMIDGRMVYERGRFLTIDYPALVARVRRAADDLSERSAGLRSLGARFEPVVRAYCEGLARRPLPGHHPCAEQRPDA